MSKIAIIKAITMPIIPPDDNPFPEWKKLTFRIIIIIYIYSKYLPEHFLCMCVYAMFWTKAQGCRWCWLWFEWYQNTDMEYFWPQMRPRRYTESLGDCFFEHDALTLIFFTPMDTFSKTSALFKYVVLQFISIRTSESFMASIIGLDIITAWLMYKLIIYSIWNRYQFLPFLDIQEHTSERYRVFNW